MDKNLIDLLETVPEGCVSGLCSSPTSNSSCSKNRHSCDKMKQEHACLTSFLSQLAKNPKCFRENSLVPKLTLLILQKRVYHLSFMQSLKHVHVYQVLNFVRWALKESSVVSEVRIVFTEDFIAYFIRLGENFSELYFDSAFQNQKMFDRILVELLLILSRVTSNKELNANIFTPTNISALVQLCASVLPTNKHSLVKCVLELLDSLLCTNLAKTKESKYRLELVANELTSNTCNIIEHVVEILNGQIPILTLTSGPPHTLTAPTSDGTLPPFPSNPVDHTVVDNCGELILSLSELHNCHARSVLVKHFILIDALSVLLNNISVDNIELTWCCCWSLAKLSSVSESFINSILRNSQALPYLFSFLLEEPLTSISTAIENDSSSSEKSQLKYLSKFLSSKFALCSLIARICALKFNDRFVVDANGVFVIAKVIFSIKHTHNQLRSEVLELIASALMVLRVLFSKEKSRPVIQSFFPVSFCDEFVSCDNYNLDFRVYLKLAQQMLPVLSQLSDEVLSKVFLVDLENRSKVSETIGKYRVVESLGDGSFGSVYKVTKDDGDGDSRHFYALKKISFNASEQSNKRKTMAATIANEVQMLKERLDHPNIVRYMKSFQKDESLYVLMEYVEGVSLQQYLNQIEHTKSHPISEAWIWNFAIQLIQGLTYLHVEKNLMHRDLSPNNILIAFDDDIIKITDFGFSRQTDPNGVCTSVVGTVGYWCPEITKKQPYSNKCDIWAYGCVLHQICTLRPPFEADNLLALARKIVEGSYKRIDVSLPYTKLLRSVIEKCITCDPQERPDALGVISLMGPKLLQQIDTQAQKLKRCSRHREELTQKLNEMQKQSKMSSSLNSSVQLGEVLEAHLASENPPSTLPIEVPPRKSESTLSLNSDFAVSPLANSGNIGLLMPNRVAPDSAGSRRSSPCATLRVPTSMLKEINLTSNPLVDSLQFLRKLDNVCNKANLKNGVRSSDRMLMSLMRRRLYECEDATWMKCEIKKLLERSHDLIDFSKPFNGQASSTNSTTASDKIAFSRCYDVLVNSCLPPGHGASSTGSVVSNQLNSSSSMTYEEFMKILDKF